jgi:cell division septum initiation protein DivIVA
MYFHATCFGYNRNEVDQYVGRLAETILRLQAENERQKMALEEASFRLDDLVAQLSAQKEMTQKTLQYDLQVFAEQRGSLASD